MYTRKVKAEQFNLFKKNIAKYEYFDGAYGYYQCKIVIDKKTYFFDFMLFSDNTIFPLQAFLMNSERDKGEKIEDTKILVSLTELVLSRHGTKG